MKPLNARLKYWVALAVTVALTSLTTNATEPRILKSTRLSSRAIAISCTNGGDPTGKMENGVLIISCGR